MPEIAGGCLCGQVRYKSSAEPIFAGICHCTACQKQSGGAFSVVIAVPQPTLSLEGETKSYTATGDSGKANVSKFCPNCGSTIVSEAELMAGASILRVGTLDDPSWVKPTMEIYCDSAQPWVDLGGDMKRFAKMPQPGG
ncbi:MAG TPA: GFA family protein [Stellaceae bacterium]|jgi:hypothetical protein|nr:GFA family protein [Stellaceae bacterium]